MGVTGPDHDPSNQDCRPPRPLRSAARTYAPLRGRTARLDFLGEPFRLSSPSERGAAWSRGGGRTARPPAGARRGVVAAPRPATRPPAAVRLSPSERTYPVEGGGRGPMPSAAG